MTANEKTLAAFETRVRQLVLGYQKLKQENDGLRAMVGESERGLRELREQLAQQQVDYQSLRMAKMMEITDGSLDDAKARLSRLIRDVNRCIAILSDDAQPTGGEQ